MHRFQNASWLALGLLVSACNGSGHGVPLPAAGHDVPSPTERVDARAFDITVTSPAADPLAGTPTTNIAATVFVPTHRKGDRFPLIVHSHGWGGNRINESDANTNNQNADTSTLYSRVVDLEVKHFWDAGYAVISFDERGIGASGGMVRIIDPEFETRDAMAVIDWAEAHLDLARDSGGDPRVGTIGGSYGGGYQLLLAALDPRVDAITPSVTWYDLNQSLQPDRVIKKGWLAGLCLVAKTDQRRMDPVVQVACEEGADMPLSKFSEDMLVSGPGITEYFAEHSLAAFERRHRDPADPYKMKPVDALLIQGMRDTLFPLNQAYANYRFLDSLGGDVRLLTHQHGHILPAPFSQNAPLGSIACGGTDTIGAIRAWMDAKLRSNTAALQGMPAVCLSLDDDAGLVLADVPVGGAAVVTIPETAVNAGNSNLASGSGGIFIPLAAPITDELHALAGIPTGSFTVTSAVPGQKSVAFVGVGVQPAGGVPALADYQIRTLRSDLDHSAVELNGVGQALHAGDTVGVLVYGDFDEYEEAGLPLNYVTNQFTISGEVRLPIVVHGGN